MNIGEQKAFPGVIMKALICSHLAVAIGVDQHAAPIWAECAITSAKQGGLA